jgi:hypothetical protein
MQGLKRTLVEILSDLTHIPILGDGGTILMAHFDPH